MTLKPEDIIREAELEIQHRTSDQLEKKAGEIADDIISQRGRNELEKIAETSPLVKLAMENSAFLNTKSFGFNHCIEKIAFNPATATAGMKFLKSLGTSEAVKRIGIGAAVGAGTGLVGSKSEDRMGNTLKGAVLGGLGGAAYHGYKGLPKTVAAPDNVSRWLGKEAPVAGSAREQALGRLGKTSDSLNANVKAKGVLSRGLASGETAIKADAFGGRRVTQANDLIKNVNNMARGSQEHTQAVKQLQTMTGQHMPGKTWMGLGKQYKEIKDGRVFGSAATKMSQTHAASYMGKAKAGEGILAGRMAGLEGKGQAQAQQFKAADKFKGEMDKALTVTKPSRPTLAMKPRPAAPSAADVTHNPSVPTKSVTLAVVPPAAPVAPAKPYVPAIQRAGEIQKSYESNVHKYNVLGK